MIKKILTLKMFKDYKDIEMYNVIAHAKRCVKD